MTPYAWRVLYQDDYSLTRVGERQIPNSGPEGHRLSEYVLQRLRGASSWSMESFPLTAQEYAALVNPS